MSPAAPNVIVVTGAASGMGLATAQLLFRAGYSIALVDLNQAALDKVVGELNGSAEGAQKAWGKATDVGKTAALKELFAAAQKELGPIYGVAHLAGILGGMGPVHEQSEEDIDRVVQVNFLGTVKVVREAVNVFRAQGNPPESGYPIVTIGSFMIIKPVPGSAIYAATKGAVKTFAQAVAKENAEVGIRINVVNPGGIRTAMTEPLIKAVGEGIPRDVVAQGRWGKPEEVGNMIEFLLSPKASFITGSTFDVDGGRNA